eukprot:TRINITY_DN17457_c0_g1_i1.p1 TRINITY_DN17457_c0_g1~~TRINITY_DN17457_c0_g1_i1.p1  ORF type:complete len:437 (+),score=99.17 TRINITY_DN17457_c0_g1_i1:71-1312(+)
MKKPQKLNKMKKLVLIIVLATAAGVVLLGSYLKVIKRKHARQGADPMKCLKGKRFVALGNATKDLALNEMQGLSDRALMSTADHAAISFTSAELSPHGMAGMYKLVKERILSYRSLLQPNASMAVHNHQNSPEIRQVISLAATCVKVGIIEPTDEADLTVLWMLCSNSRGPWLPNPLFKCRERDLLKKWTSLRCTTVGDALHGDLCRLPSVRGPALYGAVYVVVSDKDDAYAAYIHQELRDRGLESTLHVGPPETLNSTLGSLGRLEVVMAPSLSDIGDGFCSTDALYDELHARVMSWKSYLKKGSHVTLLAHPFLDPASLHRCNSVARLKVYREMLAHVARCTRTPFVNPYYITKGSTHRSSEIDVLLSSITRVLDAYYGDIREADDTARDRWRGDSAVNTRVKGCVAACQE